MLPILPAIPVTSTRFLFILSCGSRLRLASYPIPPPEMAVDRCTKSPCAIVSENGILYIICSAHKEEPYEVSVYR